MSRVEQFPDDDLLDSFMNNDENSHEQTNVINHNNESTHEGVRRRIKSKSKRSDYSNACKPSITSNKTMSSYSNSNSNSMEASFDANAVYSWMSSFGERAKEVLTNILIEDDETIHNDIDFDDDNVASLNDDSDTHDIDDNNSLQNQEQISNYSNIEGVGHIHIHLISASKAEVTDTAEGDHYAIASIEDFNSGSYTYSNVGSMNSQDQSNFQEYKTKTVRSSANPAFNKKWIFTAPTYQSCLKLVLFNSLDNAIIGTAVVSVYSLIMGKHGDALLDQNKVNAKGEKFIYTEENIPMRDPNDPSRVTGWFTIHITFKEDSQALYAKRPRLARSPEEETLSVERLVKHINRFQALINLVTEIYNEYANLMSWKDSAYTFIMFLLFVYTALYLNAEYALCCPVFLILCLFTRAWMRRVSGAYIKDLIERSVKKNTEPYRPLAFLRISIMETKYCKDPTAINTSSSSTTAITTYDSHSTNNSYKQQQHQQSSFASSLWGISSSSIPLSKQFKQPKPYVRIIFRPMKGDFIKKRKGSDDLERREFLIGLFGNSDDSNSNGSGGNTSKFNNISNVVSKDAFIHNVLDPWPKSSSSSSVTVKSKAATSTFSALGSSSSTIPSSSSSSYTTVSQVENKDEDLSFLYPVLQPLWKNVTSNPTAISDTTTSTSANDTNEKQLEAENNTAVKNPASAANYAKPKKKPTTLYVPWHENESEVIFLFYSEKPSNGLMDYVIYAAEIGSFAIVLKDLTLRKQNSNETIFPEVCQWFPAIPAPKSDKGRADYNDLGFLESSVLSTADSSFRNSNSVVEYNDNTLWAHVRIQLDTSSTRKSSSGSSAPSTDEANISLALFSLLNETEQKKNTISTIWSLRDTVEIVQNIMCTILNYIETFKNIFLWVTPGKTKPIYISLIFIWLATALVPGRYLILALGLYQFLFKFIPEPQEKPLSIKIANYLQSIPNDDDIDKVYQWERKEYVEKIELSKTQQLRQSKLNLLAPVLWSGEVHIKCFTENYESVFLMLHRKRLVWWQKESDIDEGKPFQGCMILYGHAGVTQSSLIDVRETGGNDDQIVVIFGRDSQAMPMKCTVLCRDSISCRRLEEQVKLICQSDS